MLRKHFHVLNLHHMLTFIPFTEKNIRIRYLNNHFSMMNKRTSEQSNHTNMSPSFSFLTHKWGFFLALQFIAGKRDRNMKWNDYNLKLHLIIIHFSQTGIYSLFFTFLSILFVLLNIHLPIFPLELCIWIIQIISSLFGQCCNLFPWTQSDN